MVECMRKTTAKQNKFQVKKSPPPFFFHKGGIFHNNLNFYLPNDRKNLACEPMAFPTVGITV